MIRSGRDSVALKKAKRSGSCSSLSPKTARRRQRKTLTGVPRLSVRPGGNGKTTEINKGGDIQMHLLLFLDAERRWEVRMKAFSWSLYGLRGVHLGKPVTFREGCWG